MKQPLLKAHQQMRNKRNILLVSLGFVVVLILFVLSLHPKKDLEIQTQNGIVHYRVEEALTPKQQEKGLMNRKKLDSQNGMIFLFPTQRVIRMWMKNTLIPLDMIFFDPNGWVTSVHHNAKPQDLSAISSELPVQGVLEINAGEAEQLGICEGSRLLLENMK